MSAKFHTLGETVYFHFAANDTSGSGGDGATPLCNVRLCGAAADAAPVYSPTPALLTHANYPAGCHEVAIAATEGNGFAAAGEYAVFCALTVDAQNPTGFVGGFTLGTILANATKIGGTAQTGRDIGASVLLSSGSGTGQLDFTSGVVKSNLAQILGTALTETAGLIAAGFKKFFNIATPTGTVNSLPAAAPDAAGGLPVSDAGGLDLDTKLANTNEVTAARMGALTDLIDGGRLDLLIDAIKAATDLVTAARMGALTDLIDGGRLDLLIDAIKAATDLVTAARMGALTDLIDGGRLDLLIDGIKAATDLVTAARMGALTDWINGGRLDLLLDWLINVAEGDRSIDTTATPYQGVVKIKSTATELIRKNLKQADGTNVTSTDHLVGQEVEPA